MTAMTNAMHCHSSHCTAAACTSAHFGMIMDATICLVVSIFVVSILCLRLWLKM